jgi:hypothetical protein
MRSVLHVAQDLRQLAAFGILMQHFQEVGRCFSGTARHPHFQGLPILTASLHATNRMSLLQTKH